jgi:uncharacterized protein YgbK (DUF1537 family)
VIGIGLIADDLTGACDSALPFLASGQVRVGLWPSIPRGDLACAAVSTESRSLPAEASYARSRRAAAGLAGRLLYRKLDSMLRGNPAADVSGVLDAVPGPCVVAPALPGEGRVTVGGVQRWPHGQADLAELLRPLAGRVELRDATTDGDLDHIARDVLERGDSVAAGTAGLAAALARAMGMGEAPPAPAAGCPRPLAAVGSLAAAGQAAYAKRRGWAVQILEPGALPALDGHDGLLLTGGETAARVLLAAGADELQLLGEALPRAPLARVRGGRLDGWPVVLKAGAFGGEDAVHRALEVLRSDG